MFSDAKEYASKVAQNSSRLIKHGLVEKTYNGLRITPKGNSKVLAMWNKYNDEEKLLMVIFMQKEFMDGINMVSQQPEAASEPIEKQEIKHGWNWFRR